MPTDPKEKAADAAAQAGFHLEGLAATALATAPQLKTNLETEGVVLPEEKTEEQQAAADEAAAQGTPEPAGEGEHREEDEGGEPAAEGDGTAADIQRKQDEADAKKATDDAAAAATKKADDDKKAAEALKNNPAALRDQDLKTDDDPHMRPKTRKVIEDRNAKIIEARNERDRVAAEKISLEKKVKDLEAAQATAATGKLPEAMEQELTALRQTVRELDASRDPVIKTKYDARMAVNRDSVIKTLKDDFGLGKSADGKDDPTELNAILKAGVSLSSVAPYLKKLEDAGFVNEAEGIRETLRENIRLERERQSEIATITKDYDARKQQMQQQAEGQQKAAAAAVGTAAQRILKEGIDAYNAQFPYMHDPEPPKAGDSDATVKAKNAAITEFNEAKTKVQEELKTLNEDGAAPDKQPEIRGALAANAIQHVILKHYVFPKLLKQAASDKTRIAELEADLAKVKKAGSQSKLHSAAITAPTNDSAAKNLPAGVAEGLEAFAASKGISTGN